MERLFSKKILIQNDLYQTYRGLFLSTITSFETYIEELFYHIITTSDKPVLRKYKPIIIFKNESIARAIVHVDKKYLDWLPFDRAQKRLEIYCSRMDSFKSIDKNEENALREMITVRNVLAHSSSHSKDVFLKAISSYKLPPKEQTPVGYLRSVYRITPDETRFELYQNYLISISKKFIA